MSLIAVRGNTPSMDLDQCIKGRRSVRSYLDRPVPREVIEGLLDAAVRAPSGMNLQPWRFTVIQGREVIKSLSDKTRELVTKNMPLPEQLQAAFKSGQDVVFYGAPLLILISVKKNADWRTVNLLDCGLAAENMFLFAHQEGLGSCFIGFASLLNQAPEVLAGIGIPEDHELMAPLIFGYPQEVPVAEPREAKVLKWI